MRQTDHPKAGTTACGPSTNYYAELCIRMFCATHSIHANECVLSIGGAQRLTGQFCAHQGWLRCPPVAAQIGLARVLREYVLEHGRGSPVPAVAGLISSG